MPAPIDEVSVRRDAHWLGEQGIDLTPERSEPDYEIAERLFKAGLLRKSAAGGILGIASYRLTDKAMPLAASCRAVVEADRNALRVRVLAALGG